MKPLFCLALGLACLFLTSCYVTSINPLSPPDEAKPDLRLVGDWRIDSDDDGKGDGDVARFSVRKGGWMHVDVISDKPGDKPENYDFFPTTIGKETFLNVVMIGQDDQGKTVKGYLFIRYRLKNDRVLQMWMLSQDEIEDAVEAGKLKARTDDDNNPEMANKTIHGDIDIILQDSTADLAKFFGHANLKRYFGEKTHPLIRVTPSKPPGK